MANTQIIKLFDFKSPRNNIENGISELWPKYIKRIKTLAYNVGKRKNLEPFPSFDDYFSLFSHLLIKYQPCIKDLSVQSQFDIGHFFQNFGKSRKLPITLERLYLYNASFDKPITFLRLNHLKNLKHFDIMFGGKEVFIISIIKSFPYLCPNLQSLSLRWPYSQTAKTISELSSVKPLQHLSRLKLQSPSMPTHNLKDILRNFNDSPLKHLELLFNIRDEDQFVPIARLLERQRDLQTLKLCIDCEKRFNNLEEIKIVFNLIDALLHLRNLSISIASKTRKGLLFSELYPAFTNIFTKSIPLESFQLYIEHLSISNQEFLDLFKALEPRASILKKLRIDVGDCEPDQTDSRIITNFVRNLQNIRSLKLNGLIISSKVFLEELTQNICSIRCLRSLTLREISAKIPKSTSIGHIKRILQKGSLEKFHCKIPALRNSFDNASLEKIRRINPSLVEVPDIPDFNDNQNYTIGIW